MSWKAFLVAWVAGTVGVTIGRWLWGRSNRRKRQNEERATPKRSE